MKFYGATDQGLTRPTNQDSYHIDADNCWAVVADGMGGHNGGETASTMAVDIIKSVMEKGEDPKEAILQANAQIYEKSLGNKELLGMGTTIVLAVVQDQKATIYHVGDSRAYLVKKGKLKQITTDHSIVQQLIESGTITKEQAKFHPQRNLITRAVGTEREVDIDKNEASFGEKDALLLCSDGLSSYVDKEEIEKILKASPVDEAVANLIKAANDKGGKDNITVVLIKA